MKNHSVHFCRCHLCGHISEKEGDRVEKCTNCGKTIAQFYYFNDRFTVVPSEHTMRPTRPQMEYAPIMGLTAYWENF